MFNVVKITSSRIQRITLSFLKSNNHVTTFFVLGDQLLSSELYGANVTILIFVFH